MLEPPFRYCTQLHVVPSVYGAPTFERCTLIEEAATLVSDRRLRQPSMAGHEPLLLGEICERSARLRPPSACERQGQRAQGWGWRCDAVRCGAVRCGAVRGVRLQKPQHVSRHGESERFPLHSSRHRPGRGVGSLTLTLTLTRRQWISSGLQRYRSGGARSRGVSATAPALPQSHG